MSDGDCTRCGHERYDHPRSRRAAALTPCGVHVGTALNERGFSDFVFCACEGYTVAVLPEGERLEFGRHRLEQDEAETAPAWPPLS